jgi:hypothetical protein
MGKVNTVTVYCIGVVFAFCYSRIVLANIVASSISLLNLTMLYRVGEEEWM